MKWGSDEFLDGYSKGLKDGYECRQWEEKHKVGWWWLPVVFAAGYVLMVIQSSFWG